MSKNICYLNKTKAINEGYIVDYKKYMKEYGVPGNKYLLKEYSPKLINIDGFYVYLKDLKELVLDKRITPRVGYHTFVWRNK